MRAGDKNAAPEGGSETGLGQYGLTLMDASNRNIASSAGGEQIRSLPIYLTVPINTGSVRFIMASYAASAFPGWGRFF